MDFYSICPVSKVFAGHLRDTKTLQMLPLSLHLVEASMLWDGDKLQLQAKFGVRKDPVSIVYVLALWLLEMAQKAMSFA